MANDMPSEANIASSKESRRDPVSRPRKAGEAGAEIEGTAVRHSSQQFFAAGDPFEVLRLRQENERLRAEAQAAQQKEISDMKNDIEQIKTEITNIKNRLAAIEGSMSTLRWAVTIGMSAIIGVVLIVNSFT